MDQKLHEALTFPILFNTYNYHIIWTLPAHIQIIKPVHYALSHYWIVSLSPKSFFRIILSSISIHVVKGCTHGSFCYSCLQGPNSSRGFDLCSSSCQPCFLRIGHCHSCYTKGRSMLHTCGGFPLFLTYHLNPVFLFWRSLFTRLDIFMLMILAGGSLHHSDSFLDQTSVAGFLFKCYLFIFEASFNLGILTI